MSCGVYKITNKLTGEYYIGSSKNIEKRWIAHKAPSCHKMFPNILLYKAMEQYGIAFFQLDILEKCSENNLRQLEDQYIKELQPPYNKNRAYLTEKETKELMCKSSKRWYENHPERAKELQDKWHKNHSERVKELNKRWKAAHPDKNREAARRWRENHLEECKAKNREASRKWRERKKLEKERQKQMLVLAAETQENPTIEGTLLQNKKSRQLE